MQPAARHSAAIQILDRFLAGDPVEQTLTNWARGARYAGSKDRAAVRDLVFDALRNLRSYAARGGAMSGRGIVLGAIRARGDDPDEVFTGVGHAPDCLSEDERAGGHVPTGNDALDCPDWLEPLLRDSLGDAFESVMEALHHRAPLYLRANLRKATVEEAARLLATEGIETTQSKLSPTALEVTSGARSVNRSEAFANGVVEIQDAASQALVDLLPLSDGMNVLDLCAGGGGKTLAMASRADARFYAYDANRGRMRDLPERAARAGVSVKILDDLSQAGPFDLVLCDVPCSGSGAWRRSPEGKWRLTETALHEICELQQGILSQGARLVRQGGALAYATCSLLKVENAGQVETFLSCNPSWQLNKSRDFTAIESGDGFHVSVLTQKI